jgi:hypothetical protein
MGRNIGEKIMSGIQIHQHLSRQSARVRENDQSIPRPARVRFSVKTQGVGESRLIGKQAIDFGAYMLDEPTMSFGVVTLDPLAVGDFPFATAIVLNWKTTETGLYAGAEMGFKVESMKYNIRLKFNLTFEASTMRVTIGNGTETLSAPRGTNTFNGQETINAGLL